MSTPPDAESSFTAFAGDRLVAHGPLPAVLRAAKAHLDANERAAVLIFDDHSGQQVDFDFRGSADDVIARATPARRHGAPGRPRLGVVSREVSLLPRHWEWLEAQPLSISAALRRLVDEARRHEPGKQRARAAREAASRVLTAIAGDRPGYEEAARALFARDQSRFLQHIARWPADVRTHLAKLAQVAEDLEPPAKS